VKHTWRVIRLTEEVVEALAKLADKKQDDTPDTVLRRVLKLPYRETRRLVFGDNLTETKGRKRK
jgi:hypothetical protein